MKKFGILVLGILTCSLIFSTSLFAMRFELEEFRKLPADFKAEAEPITDMDMNYCSVIKVEVDKPINLSLKQKVYKKENIDEDEFYFYVSSREDNITFQAPRYVPLTVDVPKGGLKIGTTYYVRLATYEDVDVTINVEPKDARIIVNGLTWEQPKGNLLPGEYVIFLMAEGYEEVVDTVYVSPTNTVFNYIMVEEEVMPVLQEETQKVEIPKGDKPFMIEFNDYRIRITGCEHTQETLTIILSVTNMVTERELTIIKNNTKAYDAEGNEYTPSNLEFANKTKTWNLTHNLVQNVPTKAKLIFKDIKNPIDVITLLNLGLWDSVNRDFKVSFKNIPVTQ
ncbi:MAG: PEGA domain-containing protein [Candidatus Cloacimonetes bacterium]|nr:PEGA domain-containing protein [Candidatus Cloacimonadota bacterium]